MAPPDDLDALLWHPLAPDLALRLLLALEQDVHAAPLIARVLPTLVHASGAAAGGVLRQQGRRWVPLAWQTQAGRETASGAPGGAGRSAGGAAGEAAAAPAVPEPVIFAALELAEQRQRRDLASSAVVIGPWAAAPLTTSPTLPHPPPPTLLVLRGAAEAIDRPAETAAMAARLLSLALQLSQQRQGLQRRCDRLQAMLEIAARWQQAQDSGELLHAIAEASTQLLDAERASIFLWDRRRKKLVARPALGVEGEVLEVDDHAGVVGAVRESGQPRRWQEADDTEGEVNRSVDRQLNFATRSLLAVPLNDPRGQRIGVFEVLNKRQGAFSDEDSEALEELARHAAAAIAKTRERESLLQSRDRLAERVAERVRIIGNSPAIESLRDTATRVAATDLAILILGENGTGKEVLARNIHSHSPRRLEPFVAVNCAALVETLLESELFGHEKGAFTDAHQTRQGKFELAHGGTLFLDEVGDLSPGGQAKLLRVLEEKTIVRVGGSTPIPVDVRVVAATNQPLSAMVRDKRFREDLYFRLNIVTLQLPPLRQRDGDILVLAEHFLEEFAQQVGRRVPRLSEAARRRLLEHDWPGNIRELRNMIERVSYLCPGEVLDAHDLDTAAAPRLREEGEAASGELAGTPTAAIDALSTPAAAGLNLTEATRQFQVAHIERAIDRCRGNMTDAAARLGVHRSNLYRKMRQLGMESREP